MNKSQSFESMSSKQNKKILKKDYYQQLMNLAVDIGQTYDEQVSLDDHIIKYFQGKKYSDNLINFVSEIVDGVYTNKMFFDGLVQAMIQSPVAVSRTKLMNYKVIFYLIVFRFNDMPLKELQLFLYFQEALVVYTVIQFLFDKKNIKEYALPELEKEYDSPYCLKLFNELPEKFTKLQKVIKKIKKSVGTVVEEKEVETEKPIFKTTQFKEFNLSKPKKKEIRTQSAKVSEKQSVKKVKVNYEVKYQDIEKQQEKKRLENLQKKIELTKKYQEPQLQTINRVREVREIEDSKENEQRNIDYKKVLYEEVEIPEQWKFTRAQLLKEKMNEEQEMKLEKELMIKMESNLRDSNEFNEWRRKMEQIDEQQRLEEVERKKEENKKAQEKMEKALQKQLEIKTKQAQSLKKEKEKQQKIREKRELKEIQRKHESKQVVKEIKKNYQKKVKKIQNHRKTMAVQLKDRQQEDQQLKQMQIKRELEEKQKLVKQTKEMEKRIFQMSNFAVYEKKENRFLIEDLSMSELKERYQSLQDEYQKIAEEKRQQVKEQKKREKEELDKLREKIENKHRTTKIQRQSAKLLKERELNEQRQKNQKHKENMEFQTLMKILDKKQKAADMQKELDKQENDFKLKQQFMNQEKDLCDQLVNIHLQKGKEKLSKLKQEKKLLSAYEDENAKIKKLMDIGVNKKRQADTMMRIIEQYDEYFKQVQLIQIIHIKLFVFFFLFKYLKGLSQQAKLRFSIGISQVFWSFSCSIYLLFSNFQTSYSY